MRKALFVQRYVLILLLLGILFLLDSVPAAATAAYIRVNQLGYESGRAMRAYVMTSAPISGATFVVKNADGKSVFSGSVGSTLGSWASYSIYPIDFNISPSGAYQVFISGPVTAESPSFPIDTPDHLYTNALRNNLFFYENERDGADFIRTPLRTAPGHLHDAKAAVYLTPKFDKDDNIIGALKPTGASVNAVGGWWDAGDYLKFVQTHSYTVALMLIGIRDFPKKMGAGSAHSNFTQEAKFGLDWLQQMWDDSTRSLYYQVGIGTDFESYNFLSDHDLWRLPQADDTYGGSDPTYEYIRRRPVFVSGPAGSQVSPNLAGRMAASFAECFQVFQSIDYNYANQCLLSAEHIFDLANTAPSGTLLTTAPFDFYPENEWRDDLELGATELYFALRSGNLPPGLPHTDPNYYLAAAAKAAYAYIHGPNDGSDTFNLYDVSGLAHFELYRAIELAGNPENLAVSKEDLLRDLYNQLASAVSQAETDPFEFGWPWNSYDSISHGAGLSVMASEFAYLTKKSVYSEYARSWLANISGANAWGVSFTVGDGSTFPNCMQHQVANLVGSLNGQFPVLNGAVVEGPNSAASSGLLDGMRKCPADGGDTYKKFNGNSAVYKDNVQSYSTDEPAIDLTASSFLMYAWRIAGQPITIP